MSETTAPPAAAAAESSKSGSAHVRRTLDDGVLHLLLDRPERKNAISTDMYAALAAGFAEAERDPSVRVVHVSSTGDSFTSGNDLQDFMSNPPGEDGGPVMDFLRALVTLDKPLVATVQGHAVGVGTTMLLHCDFVLAAADTGFRLPFVRLGVVPEAGSSYLLPAICGHRQAARLLMLGEPFGADEALAAGIVTEVLPADQLAARSAALLDQLVALPTGALQATKKLMRAPVRAVLEEVMRAEGHEFLARLQSPEAMEAFMAFFQKREPDFRQFS